MVKSSSSTTAMYLQIHLKFLMVGSRAPVHQDVTVFSATHICLESCSCVILLNLSLALSHCPKCLCFIFVPRMVGAILCF